MRRPGAVVAWLACSTVAAEGTFAGRSLPDPGFAGDDGAAPAELAAALVSGDGRAVVTALLTARVLVPVVAVLDEVEIDPDGLAHDKSADMAVVTVRAPSGRLALPAFSSVAALMAWNSSARPVPVAGVLAARAAYDEGADTLLLDPAGPARVVIDGPLLRALAEARAPLPPLEDPVLHAAIVTAAVGVGLRADQVALEAGESVDLVVRLTMGAGVADGEATALARALGAALAADPVVGSRLERGLDLAVDRPVAG